ncbi:RCC1-like domain-containing protein [Streptomyces sp. SA3_actF]|nr:RCC1 domain-containing protein [Streptomyces sp. SA3_actF]
MAAGAAHTLGLRADGTVLAAGNDAEGQCRTGAWSGVHAA